MVEATRYLAVFLGAPDAFANWTTLSEQERRTREQQGLAAWKNWTETHAERIGEMGGPLGRTKKASRDGVADVRNEIGGFTLVRTASHDEAAAMFENHPHFTIFPGDRVEIMPIMPVPMG